MNKPKPASGVKVKHETMSQLMLEQAKRYEKTGKKTSIIDLIDEAVKKAFKSK